MRSTLRTAPGAPSATATRSVNQAATSPSARSIASVRAWRSARLAASAPSRLIRFGVAALADLVGAIGGGLDDELGLVLAELGGDGEELRPGPGGEPTRPRLAGAAEREQRSASSRTREPRAEPRKRPRSRSPSASAVSAASCSGPAPGSSAASRRSSAAGAQRREGDPLAAAADRLEQPRRLGGDQDQVGVRGGSSSVFSSAFWLSSAIASACLDHEDPVPGPRTAGRRPRRSPRAGRPRPGAGCRAAAARRGPGVARGRRATRRRTSSGSSAPVASSSAAKARAAARLPLPDGPMKA